jgi:hypothetical protein
MTQHNIRRLAQLKSKGTPEERAFAELFVTSYLPVSPDKLTSGQFSPAWGVAWAKAENEWQKEVQRLVDADPSHDFKSAEERVSDALATTAKARIQDRDESPAP